MREVVLSGFISYDSILVDTCEFFEACSISYIEWCENGFYFEVSASK